MEPFPHQKEGIEFLREKKHAILADEMGLGKTLQAIMAAGQESDGTTLVVCPASLKVNWEREIHMVYPEDVVEIIQGGADPNLRDDAAWIIINYDILDKHRELLTKMAAKEVIETAIFDEAHYMKDTKTIRTKASLAIALHVKRVYLLTGTPVMNRPIELFPLLRAVRHPLAYKEGEAVSTLRRAYGKRYCGAYYHRLGFTGRGFWDETGATRIPELRVMTMDVILRRTKEEVLDLPEKIVSVVPIEISSESRKQYNEAWQVYLQWLSTQPLNKQKIADVLSAQGLIELGKLKQICSLAKIDRMAADVENAVEQGSKVIIFSQYTKTIVDLRNKMFDKKITCVTLTGEDDQDSRQKSVDIFQKGGADVFIANIKAGGVGITLTAASIVMFADMEWSPGVNQQAEDRAHRIGQTGTVNVYYYIAENTVEDDIIDILTAKQDTIGTLTGGDRTIKPFMERLQKRVMEAR